MAEFAEILIYAVIMAVITIARFQEKAGELLLGILTEFASSARTGFCLLVICAIFMVVCKVWKHRKKQQPRLREVE